MDQSRWTDISMRLTTDISTWQKLAGTLGVHDDRPMRNPELLLEQHGWVKVTGSIWPSGKITQRNPGIAHVYHADTGKNPCGPRFRSEP